MEPEAAKIAVKASQKVLSLEDEFDEFGLTLSLSARVIKEAHEAERIDRDDEGTMIVPDHRVRLDAAKLHLALRGYQTQNNRVEVHGNLNISLAEIKRRIDEKLSSGQSG
jgi:hypothetical protein